MSSEQFKKVEAEADGPIPLDDKSLELQQLNADQNPGGGAQKENKAEEDDNKSQMIAAPPNLVYLNLYVLALGLGGFQLGWAISGNNQTANIIATKFGWTEEETKLYNTIINLSSIFGMGSGSIIGGQIIPMGRRKTILIFNIFCILSLLLSIVLNLYAIVIGKLVFGFSTGVLNVAGPKMLDETVPTSLLGAFGIATNTYICLGIFISMLIGAGLPGDGDVEGFKNDEFWRVVYAFPIVFSFLELIVFACIVRVDSIVFSIKKGWVEDAKYLISKVYRVEPDQIDSIYDDIRNNIDFEEDQSGNQEVVTLKQAMFDRNYRRSTWIVYTMTIFNQWTGIDAVNIYSNRLMNQMNQSELAQSSGRLTLSANTGTIILGSMNFVGSVFAYFSVNNFGRVPVLFWCRIMMGALHITLAICILYGYNFAAIMLIAVFIFIFQLSEGPILWIYSAEVCHDSAFGLAVLGQFLNMFIISSLTEYIAAGLGPQGFFFLLGGSTLLGALFIKLVVKETDGLTDKEKKNLYRPVNDVTVS